LFQLAELFAPEFFRYFEASDTVTGLCVETRHTGDWREIEPTEVDGLLKLARDFGDILLYKLDV